MTAIAFETTPHIVNKWTIIVLPGDVSAQLPSRGQVMTKLTIDGKTSLTVMEPDGRGGHWFKVTSDMPVKLEDKLNVTIEPTKDWPEPEIPADFEKALNDKPAIKTFFKTVTPMAKWEWVRWINSTNVQSTRQKRIEVSIDKLRKGMRRPCCFNRAACTEPAVSKNAQLIEPALAK